jgi:hypothetical protein
MVKAIARTSHRPVSNSVGDALNARSSRFLAQTFAPPIDGTTNFFVDEFADQRNALSK